VETATELQPEIVDGVFKHPGGELLFRLFNNQVCIRISEEILAGNTYPEVPFVNGVKTILDIGANIGAASVWLATTYPGATVYALEPGSRQFGLLQQNVASLNNVRFFPFGLFSSDKNVISDATIVSSRLSLRLAAPAMIAKTSSCAPPRASCRSKPSNRSTSSNLIPRDAKSLSFGH